MVVIIPLDIDSDGIFASSPSNFYNNDKLLFKQEGDGSKHNVLAN
jgi:hypothetical protein